jgi:hypothetical protein
MPWVRKTEEDRASELQEAKGVGSPFLAALGVSALAAFLLAIGYRGRGTYAPINSPRAELLRKWPLVALVFVIAFVVFFRHRRRTGDSLFMPTDALICVSCFESHGPEVQQCECGGTLEPLRNWRWQDEQGTG